MALKRGAEEDDGESENTMDTSQQGMVAPSGVTSPSGSASSQKDDEKAATPRSHVKRMKVRFLLQ